MAMLPTSCDVGYKYFTVSDGFGLDVPLSLHMGLPLRRLLRRLWAPKSPETTASIGVYYGTRVFGGSG
jgi:hypothetical protein